MTVYRVYNHDKSDYFETTDKQLAYEVRKGSDTNCHSDDREAALKAVEFCEKYSWHEDCTVEERPEKPGWYHVTVSRPENHEVTTVQTPDFKDYVMNYDDWFYYDGKNWDLSGVEPYDTVIKIIKQE